MKKTLTYPTLRESHSVLRPMTFRSGRVSLLLAASLFAVIAFQGMVQGQGPEISDPGNQAPPGSMPGVFPERVTSANVNAAPISGSTLGGSGSDNILVTFPSSGPIAWTESRHNEGDIALLIGPFDPNDASYYPPPTHVNDYKPLEGGQAFANTTLAWRVGRETGALLATVRHNGVNNGDEVNGGAVGITHGIAYFNTGGQGWGYRMSDGVFANGGGGSSDLQMGIAGADGGAGEAVFNFAASYFPYSEGWLGGWVNDGFAGTAEFDNISPNLDPSVVTYVLSDDLVTGFAVVDLPDIDSAADGMLFVAPTDDGNSTNIAAAFPNGSGGWNVTVREDEDADFSGQTSNFGVGNKFQFLYVPYDAANLVGGHVNGVDASLINSAGNNRFSISRTQAGEYAVSVFDTDGTTKLTENDGSLILSVAASLPEDTTQADRKFMSYEFDSVSGDFIVQSRELVANNSANSENTFGDELALRDVDFYFAFVDFSKPMSLSSGLLGDANGDGNFDFGDIEAFFLAITDLPAYMAQYPDIAILLLDMNADGNTDFGDIEAFFAALTAG